MRRDTKRAQMVIEERCGGVFQRLYREEKENELSGFGELQNARGQEVSEKQQ